MGLRYASVRQPNVVVMAPALTETTQPQGFPLKSGTLSSPVSLISYNDNTETNFTKCTRRLRFLDNKNIVVGMNGDSENISDYESPHVNFEKVRLKDEVNKATDGCNQGIAKESDYSLLQIGGFMMNNSSSAVGEENMGLQKSNTNISNSEMKLDIPTFKPVGASTIPQPDIGAGGDIGHNVDEIMQVIKNMESKGNEIDDHLEPNFQINDGNDITSGLSTFEREFFNDVDMMNMCVDENLTENGLAIVNHIASVKERCDGVGDTLFKVVRKLEWIKRKISKLQMRAMSTHIGEELSGLLKYVSDLLADISSNKTSTLYSALTCKVEKENVDESSNFSMSSLLRRLDQSSQQQAHAASQHHVPCKYFGSGSSDNTCGLNKQCYPTSGSIIPKLSSDVCKELDNVSGELIYQLHATRSRIDSDETASSSGGESCDEMHCFSNLQPQTMTISKRALWRWAQDRARIGSRWVWLQAHISDLEYRIRQVSDINKQIRTGKGGVVLGGDEPPKLCDSVVVNGFHGVLPGTNGKSVDDETVTESSCRTRPLKRSSFRKRKLLQTVGLHLTSKKAAKPTTVHCGCHPPLPSCALCTGRLNPTQPHEDNDLLTLNERVALLDPTFHPILSFMSDVSQSLHFDAIMKTTDWQFKAQRTHLKTPALMRVMDNTEEGATSDTIGKRPLLEQQRRRYLKRSATTTAMLDEKIRKKAKKRRTKMLGESNNHSLERFKARRSFSSLKAPGSPCSDEKVAGDTRNSEEEGSSEPFMVLSGAIHPSPIPSPSPTPHCSKERDASRRKRENSYDIDNIVIPYSVAASTRLEKLEYKEILTPKWRVLPVEPTLKIDSKNNGLIRRPSQEDDDQVEDLSDELLVNRHEKCLQEEKKKFSTYLKLPNSMVRSRSQRRADSRAESSGGNTPDPMSPAPADGRGSPIISPPATPQPLQSDGEYHTRRRTLSRCVSPVEPVPDEVAPYELRTFPLSDETYEKMLRIMPPGHPFNAYSSSHPNFSHDSEGESRPVSPLSDSTESADTFVDEDPNDPEWTVGESSVERVPFKR